MKRVFFEFNDLEQKYTYEEGGTKYYLAFALMIKLKGYLREVGPKTQTLDAIKKWYSELSESDKKEVIIKSKLAS